MRTRTQITVLLAAVALAAAALSSCKTSAALAPDGSELTVSASPADVVIDLEAGESRGEAVIEARLFAGAFPLEDVAVTFDSDGGTLSSSDNGCAAGGTCARTGGACATNADCPAVAPLSVETDALGVARDTLILTLVDPTSIEVSARSGSQVATVSVTKTISTGNQPPEAVIEADPPNSQRSGQPVIFDGSESSDPDGIITCYQWAINGAAPVQGRALTSVVPVFSFALAQLPQTVSVVLRVSDDPSIATECDVDDPAVPSQFFRGLDTITYNIVCDTSPPVLSVPGTVNAPASSGATFVDVSLTGVAQDAESGIQSGSAAWSCGDAAGFTPGAARTCRYTSNANWVATFRATNTCGQTTSANVTVNVTGLPRP